MTVSGHPAQTSQRLLAESGLLRPILAMNLPMTVRVYQNAVFEGIQTPFDQRNDMMQPPPGFPRDRLFASGAESVLFPPVVQQFLFPLFGSHHLSSQPIFQVGCPGRVERIGFPFDLGMPVDAGVAGIDKRDPFGSLDVPAGKHPIPSFDGVKVFLLDPSFSFQRMPAFGPLP